MRHDFSKETKEILAKRVAMRCSAPTCNRITSAPSSAKNKAVNIGVAAHITAASSGGPRFDSSLTPEQRQSLENGIWLCQSCAKLVDNDPMHFDADVLRKWKRIAEDQTRLECVSNAISARGDTNGLSQQSSKILSFGRELQFSFDKSCPDSEERLRGFCRDLHNVISLAFMDTCMHTPYEDFVYIGSFFVAPPDPPESRLRFSFELSCHVTRFVSAFQELMDNGLNEPGDKTRSLPEYASGLKTEFECIWDVLVPYRISRLGPKRVAIQVAERVRSFKSPFTTSSLLALLGQIRRERLLVLDDVGPSDEEVRLLRYLASVNDKGTFSLDDFIVDKKNAEQFSIR